MERKSKMEVRDFDDLTRAIDKLVQEKGAKIAELEKELSEAKTEIERLNIRS